MKTKIITKNTCKLKDVTSGAFFTINDRECIYQVVRENGNSRVLKNNLGPNIIVYNFTKEMIQVMGNDIDIAPLEQINEVEFREIL